MKNCIKCGHELSDEAIFCHVCGAKQVQEPKKCFKCGSPLVEGSTFCSKCGIRQDSNTPQATQAASLNSIATESPSVLQTASKPIQNLKNGIAPELMAVAICFFLAAIEYIQSTSSYSFVYKHSESLATWMVFNGIFTCIASIVAAVLIFTKKEKLLVFPFATISILKFVECIIMANFALGKVGGAASRIPVLIFFYVTSEPFFVIMFELAIVMAYFFITLDSFKIYQNKTLLPKFTKLYSVVALIAIYLHISAFPAAALNRSSLSAFFMSAAFIIYLIYILHNNKNDKIHTNNGFSIAAIVFFLIGAICGTFFCSGNGREYLGTTFYTVAFIIYLAQSTKSPKTETKEEQVLTLRKSPKISSELMLAAAFFITLFLCIGYLILNLNICGEGESIFSGSNCITIDLDSFLFRTIILPLIAIVSIPILIFVKKERLLFFPFCVLAIMSEINYFQSITGSHITPSLLGIFYHICLDSVGYIILVWASFNILKNKPFHKKWLLIYAMIALYRCNIIDFGELLGIAHVDPMDITNITISFGITLSLTFIMYLKWVYDLNSNHNLMTQENDIVSNAGTITIEDNLVISKDNFIDKGDYIELVNPIGNIRMIEKSCSPDYMNWNDAMQYAKNLRKGGFNDWRIPTIDELKIIYKIKDLFSINREDSWVWSSSTLSQNPDRACDLYFGRGLVDDSYKSTNYHVRCVR